MSTLTFQQKPDYSALPARILKDPTFTALDLRVLAAIAWHDRFNKNGMACFASNATIGERAGCHANSAGRAIGRLLKLGAIKDLNKSPGKQRSRRRMLTVVYTEDDLGGPSEVTPAPATKPRQARSPAARELNRRVELAPAADAEVNPSEVNPASARELNREAHNALETQEDRPADRVEPASSERHTNSTATVDIREQAEAYKDSACSLFNDAPCNLAERPSPAERARVEAMMRELIEHLREVERAAISKYRTANAALARAANERLLQRHGRPKLSASLLGGPGYVA